MWEDDRCAQLVSTHRIPTVIKQDNFTTNKETLHKAAPKSIHKNQETTWKHLETPGITEHLQEAAASACRRVQPPKHCNATISSLLVCQQTQHPHTFTHEMISSTCSAVLKYNLITLSNLIAVSGLLILRAAAKMITDHWWSILIIYNDNIQFLLITVTK